MLPHTAVSLSHAVSYRAKAKEDFDGNEAAIVMGGLLAALRDSGIAFMVSALKKIYYMYNFSG